MKIFFDVDGVLIDGWHANPELRKPWDMTIEEDLGVDRDAFQQLFFGTPGDRFQSRMFACVTGQSDLKAALAEVLPQVGYAGSVNSFVQYWFEKDSNLNASVIGLVSELRQAGDIKLYLATGQEHYRARYLWNNLGLSWLFDGIFYSAEIGHPKKDVRFFEAINAALGISGDERPLFFDDQPEIVALAAQAGWDGRAFSCERDIRQHPRLRGRWP
ncbi:HAD family hydrolase [Rhizobium sp. BK538]|uniref:HAD family hydrolase n=1 Tax=Rhizobium sp. BK538 TaxID=2586984 RepID=UPI001616A1CA